MSDTQLYLRLPHFRSRFSLEQYRTFLGSFTVNEGRITNRLEAVHYALQSCVTFDSILESMLNLSDATRKPGEKEMEQIFRRNKVVTRGGSVHLTDEKMALFSDGVHPVKIVDGKTTENAANIGFLELVASTQAKYDVVRARRQQCR